MGLLLVPGIAAAHVEVASGPAVANASQEVTFEVGHGCSGADTYAMRIEIPAGVASVRPERSDFGPFTVEKDPSGTVIAVTWQKSDADLLPEDLAFYKLTIRMKVPNTPFTTLYFPAHQTCKDGEGNLRTTDWVGTPDMMTGSDGGTLEKAPALAIVPAHSRGWNKLTVTQAINDLSDYFGDAEIVWKDTAAWSANPTTRDLITSTDGVTELSSLQPNDVIWVRY